MENVIRIVNAIAAGGLLVAALRATQDEMGGLFTIVVGAFLGATSFIAFGPWSRDTDRASLGLNTTKDS